MLKRVLIILVTVIVLAVLFEIVSLLRLRNSLGSYATYWRQRAALKGELTYVALGDSSAQGIGATEPMHGYVGLLAKKIEAKTGKTVRIVNISVSGADVDDVLQKQIPQLDSYRPDIVTISIGGNDVARNKLDNFASEMDTLGSRLPDGTYMANLPYFGGRIRRNTEALKAGEIVAATAKKHDLRLVDLQTPLREKNSPLNYASDLFHPSNTAYRIWAEAFWKQISPNI